MCLEAGQDKAAADLQLHVCNSLARPEYPTGQGRHALSCTPRSKSDSVHPELTSWCWLSGVRSAERPGWQMDSLWDCTGLCFARYR